MATSETTRGRSESEPRVSTGTGNIARRLSTETKSFFKTSEFVAYAIVFVGILIAANTIEKAEGGRDLFTADKAWLYVTILTVGYMVSRGIAKAGVADRYWAERGDSNPKQ
jgi:NhaP-type Na+/H+ or K+/H+ antiporter